MTTPLEQEFESAAMELEDEAARNHIKIVIEGDWEDLWGELTITHGRYTEERETYFSNGADSIHACLVEMVRDMLQTRKREGKS